MLEEGFAYDSLIDVAPTNPAAASLGKLRVAPGDPDNSSLWHKITADLVDGEGGPMPFGSEGLATLSPDLADLIRKWILAGAPEDGIVAGTGDGDFDPTGDQPTIDPLAPPAPGQGYQVKVELFDLNGQSELEGCVFVQLPNEEEIFVSGYEISQRPGSHHFIVYQYDGEACDHDDDGDGTPNCLDPDSAEAFPPEFVEDVGCNDEGPADRFRKGLIAGTQIPHDVVIYPEGIALKLKPRQGLLLNSHYINYYGETQGEVDVNFYTIPASEVKYAAVNLFDVIANSFIDVPPFSTGQASWGWSPSTRVALPGITSHMHKRGTQFTIDHYADDGSSKNPAKGPMVPEGDRHLYVSLDYADPENIGFNTPLIIEPGERLVYTCSYDNGVDRPVRMGCEEEAGEAPGTPLQPAQACSENADCAGFGTEKCVPANIVFGFTSDDEMCIMPGVYYEIMQEDDGTTSLFSTTQATDSVDNAPTSGVDANFTPSLSGDGTRMAFAASTDPVGDNADGSVEIFTSNLSTSPPTAVQITNSTAASRGSAFPVLSNDGSIVVFTSNDDLVGSNADGNVEIFAANFDGTNLRQLTNTSSGVNGPFVDTSGLVNVLGLAISPHGSVVSFVSNAPIGSEDGSSQEVLTIHSDGINLQQITDGTVANDVAPTLSMIGVSMSGDASLITFASTGNYTGNNGLGLSQIYTINADGTNLQQLTSFGQVKCPEGHGNLCINVFATPTMSNDGGRIGYLQTLINVDNQAAPEFLNSEPFIMNADGTGLRQLYSAPVVTQNCSPADLSQDGSRASFICYASVRMKVGCISTVPRVTDSKTSWTHSQAAGQALPLRSIMRGPRSRLKRFPILPVKMVTEILKFFWPA